ncbi:MAG: SIS domain-containing protein [Ruminococcaceae bacterium]|nr:SIS domain-containing protein [Oscillospiraceae bacterium]
MNRLWTKYPALEVCRADIENAVSLIVKTYRAGGKLLLCGNGGSAADCEHIAGELLKGFLSARKITDPSIPEDLRAGLQGSLPAIPLPSITAAFTASINDMDPSMVYAQLLHGLGKKGDLLVAISTSGNAKNVNHAASLARAMGITVLALTGEGGGALKELADVAICVPERETYLVQEYHLPVYHYLCAEVERTLF